MILSRSAIVSILASLSVGSAAAAQGANACADAQVVKSYGTVSFSTVGATTDGVADPLCNFFSNSNIYNDVWFRFTAPASEVIEIATCSLTTFDTKFAVYAESCSGAVLACNDDVCSLQSRITMGVTAGSTYLIRLGGYNPTATGSGSISVAPLAYLGDVTDPVTGTRYVALNGTSWTASEALAQQIGGHLVSINTPDEQEFVWQNFGNLGGVDRRIWIGFNDVATEGAWQWSDGTAGKYTNWNAGEPNNSGLIEDYAEMLGSTGKWNDINDVGAGFAHIMVVELPGDPPTPCPADLNGDGNVGAADLSLVLGAWNTSGADITGDGFTDASDLSLLLGAWGACP
ncbi:MAG: hypothetical protein LW636_01350 [Planctomycetaceae bacterium]|nr:hypothetical protein [Planctomycetaceae bacterium]